MTGLAVDGFVVEWGADTRQYEMANKRVRDDAKKSAFVVEKEWGDTVKKTTKGLLGFQNVGRAAMIGVGAAAGLAVAGVRELGKSIGEVDGMMKRLDAKREKFLERVGMGALQVGDPANSGMDALLNVQSWLTDLVQGAGTSAMQDDVVAQRKAQTENNAARLAVTGRAKDARKESLGAIEVGDARYLDARRQLIQSELDAKAKSVQADLISGDAIRVRAAREVVALAEQRAAIEWNAAQDAEDQWWKGAQDREAARQKERDDVVAAEQAASEQRQKERDDEAERLAAQRADLAGLREGARLAELRATGRGEEAEAAQVQARYEQDIARVRDVWGMDFDEKLSTIDALQRARDAELGAIGQRGRGTDIGGTLAAGSFSGQAMAQAFGGAGADLKAGIEKSQLQVLQSIDKNIRNLNPGMVP